MSPKKHIFSKVLYTLFCRPNLLWLMFVRILGVPALWNSHCGHWLTGWHFLLQLPHQFCFWTHGQVKDCLLLTHLVGVDRSWQHVSDDWL